MVERDRALKNIRNAWVAAYASAAVMLVAVVVAAIGGLALNGADYGRVLEIAILMALAFGVHMKSRAAAVVLLGYFAVGQVLLRAGFGMGASGVFLIAVLGYLYVKGVIGTFALHRIDAAEADHEDRALVSA